MLISQRVNDRFTLPAEFYQTALLKDPKLMGNGTLAHSQKQGDIADTHLMFQKHIKNFDSRRVTEDFEKLGETDEELVLWCLFFQ